MIQPLLLTSLALPITVPRVLLALVVVVFHYHRLLQTVTPVSRVLNVLLRLTPVLVVMDPKVVFIRLIRVEMLVIRSVLLVSLARAITVPQA